MISPKHLPVNNELLTGVDVGGTKVHITSSSSDQIHAYRTHDYSSMESVLDRHFSRLGERPVRICVAMAGPRDDLTGNVTGTNFSWPVFSPSSAESHFPGTHFKTVNDMVGTAAGVLALKEVELETVKPGRAVSNGTKLIMAISTGIGAAAAVWDDYSARHIFVASEGGHIGFQPQSEQEYDYLGWLQNKYSHASAELALSGRHGIENIVEHSLGRLPSKDLLKLVSQASHNGEPLGATLRYLAENGSDREREATHAILHNLGSMLGSVTRDLTLAFNATGGVYLTGSVALGLGNYFAKKTDYIKRFIKPGAVHDEHLENIPIRIVRDPNVAVKGALSLA